jgi:hypothetical protein
MGLVSGRASFGHSRRALLLYKEQSCRDALNHEMSLWGVNSQR